MRKLIRIVEASGWSQLYCVVDATGRDISPEPNASMRDIFQRYGIPHFGPFLEQGYVVASVMRVDRQEITVHIGKQASVHAVESCLRLLTAVPGVSPSEMAAVNLNGVQTKTPINAIVSLMTAPPVKPRKTPRRPHPEILQFADDEAMVEDADCTGARYERVVWEQTDTLETNPVSDIGFNAAQGVFGIHVTSDLEFWFTKLVSDYGRDDTAYVVEIIGRAGDVLVDDPQYAIPEDDGTKAHSGILLTHRQTLLKGRDFRYVRTLTRDDLIELSDEQDHPDV